MDEGYKVLVALPQGTNGPKPALPQGAQGGDAAMLWAADKWLIVHKESGKGELGAWVGLVGENIDIADILASDPLSRCARIRTRRNVTRVLRMHGAKIR